MLRAYTQGGTHTREPLLGSSEPLHDLVLSIILYSTFRTTQELHSQIKLRMYKGKHSISHKANLLTNMKHEIKKGRIYEVS